MTKAEAAALAKPHGAGGKKKLEVPPMPAKPDYARPRPAAAATDCDDAPLVHVRAAMGVLFGSSLAIGFTSLAVDAPDVAAWAWRGSCSPTS